MASRRARKVSHNSDPQPEGPQGVDKLRKRKELFIQQYEKAAQERINEMEATLDILLATLDRAFKIEVMKHPQSLHTALIKDVLDAQEISVGEVTMAIASASPEISRPLSRKSSKKSKASNSVTQPKASGQIRPDDRNKRQGKKKMQSSNSSGSLRCTSTTSSMRTNSRVVKLGDQAPGSGLKSRLKTRSLSEGLSGNATAMVMTSLGETLLLSEENKDEVKLELLDDLALYQMQKIKELMEYLCKKVKLNNTQ